MTFFTTRKYINDINFFLPNKTNKLKKYVKKSQIDIFHFMVVQIHQTNNIFGGRETIKTKDRCKLLDNEIFLSTFGRNVTNLKVERLLRHIYFEVTYSSARWTFFGR